MEQIKLNDGELAVVLGEASIIMNVNTAFELVEKSKDFIGCTNEEKQEVNDDNDADLCEEINDAIDDIMENIENEDEDKPEEEVSVVAFVFDEERAEYYNDLREGICECWGKFSISQASDRYKIEEDDIKFIIKTWNPYLHRTEPMTLKFRDSGKKNEQFTSRYNGKKLKWTEYYWDPNHKCSCHLVFFRSNEIPQFILDKDCTMLNAILKR